jgi:hypothetical protein
VLDQHLQQQPQPGGIVADPAFGHQLATVVDHRDVVVILRPVNPAEHRQRFALAFSLVQNRNPRRGHAPH